MATKSEKTQHLEVLNERIRQSKSYREFLRIYLELRDLSLSDFARATGFGRGFPGDVLCGRRRLTAKSYQRFERALKVPLAGKKLFRCLVALEEPDLFPDFISSESPQTLAALRAKPWITQRRQLQEVENPGLDQLLKNRDVIGVYAAAGRPEEGASRAQIARRTDLPQRELEKCLEELETFGLLEKREEHYFPRDLHLFLKTSNPSRMMTTLFQKAAEKAHRRAPIAVGSEAELFFTSQFCIRESTMPALKSALRETILKFVDESIEPDGDRVVQLLTTLHL